MVEWLEWLFDYIDRHPRAVAMTLFGICLAGAIGGGLYVRSLHTALDSLEATTDQRISNLEDVVDQRISLSNEQRQRDSTIFSNDMRLVDTQVHSLVTALTGLDRSLRELHSQYAVIRGDTSISRSTSQEIERNMEAITGQLDTIKIAMATVSVLDQLRHTQTDALKLVLSDDLVTHREFALTNSLVVMAAAFTFLFLLINFVYDRRRQTQLKSEVEELREELSRQEATASKRRR